MAVVDSVVAVASATRKRDHGMAVESVQNSRPGMPVLSPEEDAADEYERVGFGVLARCEKSPARPVFCTDLAVFVLELSFSTQVACDPRDRGAVPAAVPQDNATPRLGSDRDELNRPSPRCDAQRLTSIVID